MDEEKIAHEIDNLLYLQSLATIALAEQQISIDEYELYRDYILGIVLGYRKLQGKEDKMLKKLLIKLVMKAYKEGRRDERNHCEADDSFFEKLVEEIL